MYKGAARVLHFNARRFSTATRLQAPSGLKINSQRLWDTLHETCEWGATHRYGEYVSILPVEEQNVDVITEIQQTLVWRV